MLQASIKEHHFGYRLSTTVASVTRVLVVVTTAYPGKSYLGNSVEDPSLSILSASDCAEERSRESSRNNVRSDSALSEEAERLEESSDNSMMSTFSPTRAVEVFYEECFKGELSRLIYNEVPDAKQSSIECGTRCEMDKDRAEDSNIEETRTAKDSGPVNYESSMLLPSMTSATEGAPKVQVSHLWDHLGD